MRLTTILAIGAALVVAPGVSLAQQKAAPMQGMDHSKMQGMDHSKMQGMDHSKMRGMNHQGMSAMQMSPEQVMMHGGPAGAEYHANMQKMHQSMMQMSMDRDPTRSWAAGMIAHHQGAIDNSRTVLKHTQDAEARRLANKTIKENQKGIAELQSWLSRHGGRQAAR